MNLFGRLAAGNFPDIEQLSAFGLSKSMFAQQGIKFDAGGSLVSSARDTFDALLRIVDTKYATILDKMSKTTESKLASLQDKWEGAMRSLGAGLIEVLSPVIDYFTKFLDKLTTSGAMGDLVNRFLSPFKGFTEALTNGDAQAAVDRLLASVSGFVASIPTILQSTFENIAKLLENIFANIQRFMTESSPKTMGAYRGATDRLAIDEFLGRISHEEFLRKQAALDKRYGMNATPVLMEGVDFGKTFADTQKFIDGIIEKIGKANLPETATGAPKPEGPVGTIADTAKATTDESNDLLFRIAKNTRDSADALTLRRETLGGGTMGAIGLTGAEVAAVNGSYGMFGNGLIPAGTDLERAMRRIIRDESRRNGQPGVMGRF